MATNGNVILVYSGSTLIAGMKSNEMQTECDLEPVSAPGDGDWKHYKKGRKGGDLQIGYLVAADTSAMGVSGGNGVRDLLLPGTSFNLVFKKRGANDSAGVSGSYILKTCKINSVIGNLVTGSFHFVLNGALT
jgi:hypothetical protein